MGNFLCCKDNTEKIEENESKNLYFKLDSSQPIETSIRYIYIDSLEDL